MGGEEGYTPSTRFPTYTLYIKNCKVSLNDDTWVLTQDDIPVIKYLSSNTVGLISILGITKQWGDNGNYIGYSDSTTSPSNFDFTSGGAALIELSAFTKENSNTTMINKFIIRIYLSNGTTEDLEYLLADGGETDEEGNYNETYEILDGSIFDLEEWYDLYISGDIEGAVSMLNSSLIGSYSGGSAGEDVSIKFIFSSSYWDTLNIITVPPLVEKGIDHIDLYLEFIALPNG